MHLTGLLVLAFAFTWLTGCSNALYFYETDKIAMSLQGRPDSSQPVQGSLGLKQRVAVVAPPKDPDTMTKARSDSVSMISTFRFRKDKGGFADLGPVTIQTALVTGSAANALPEKAPAVARAQVIGTAAAVAAFLTKAEIQSQAILDFVTDPDGKLDRNKLDQLAAGTSIEKIVQDQSDSFDLKDLKAKLQTTAPSGDWFPNIDDLFKNIP